MRLPCGSQADLLVTVEQTAFSSCEPKVQAMIRLCAINLFLLTLFAAAPAPPAAIADFGTDIELPVLKETLGKGLRARRQAEFDFIARVVRAVDRGAIPIDMVEETFHWARRQHKRHPFPYFEHAMRIRARQIGISL